MPRHRTHNSRTVYAVSSDFPQRLLRFKEESRLPRAEIACCLGGYPHTVWRWQRGLARPNGEQ